MQEQQEENNKKANLIMQIRGWFSWDKLLIFLSLTILGWAAFMKVSSGVIGAYIVIFGFCMGLIWLLRRPIIQGYFNKISDKVHSKIPIIVSVFIVILFIAFARFSPLWQRMVDYTSNGPYQQMIRTDTSTVEVSVSSKEDVHSNYIDRGGYLAFGKGTEALLVTSGIESLANQTGSDVVVYHGVFSMDALSNATQQKILFLKQAEYVQINFASMPEKLSVQGGKTVVIINNSVRLEFIIPPQQMSGNYIIIPNIQEYLYGIMDESKN